MSRTVGSFLFGAVLAALLVGVFCFKGWLHNPRYGAGASAASVSDYELRTASDADQWRAD